MDPSRVSPGFIHLCPITQHGLGAGSLHSCLPHTTQLCCQLGSCGEGALDIRAGSTGGTCFAGVEAQHFNRLGARLRWGAQDGVPCRIQGVPAHLPGTNKRPTFLFTPSLWLEGVTSTTPLYPSSWSYLFILILLPSLECHPHGKRSFHPGQEVLSNSIWGPSGPFSEVEGMDPDEGDAKSSFSVKPTKEKGIRAERSGWANCVHKCVRACVSVSAGRQARVVAKRSVCARVPAGRVSHQPVSDSCA